MEQKYYFSVQGTTCSSCEILIEREIKNLDGILDACVSHKQGTVCVTVCDNRELSPNELDQLLGTHGYSFKTFDKTNTVNKKWNWGRIGKLAILIFVVYLFLKKTGFLTYSPSIEATSGMLGVFMIGLIASISSCTAVLGGLIVAVSASVAKEGETLTTREKMRSHYLLNAGRLTGFLFFGAIIGLVGSLIQLSIGFNGFLILIVAVLMIGLGINLLDVIPNGVSVIRPPKWLSHKIHNLSSSNNPKVPFVLGALTFFLPCGFTQAMQLYALSLGDYKASAILMGVFALGTLPALLGIGKLTSSAKGNKLKRITKFVGIIVIVLGISNIQNAFALLDFRPLPSTLTTTSRTIKTPPVLTKYGTQIIQMEVSSRGAYIPNVLTVVEGVPVRWEIYGAKFMGCADSLIMRQFNINTHLNPGSNVVKFTPNKIGSFTFSCSMGMIRGTMNVVPKK